MEIVNDYKYYSKYQLLIWPSYSNGISPKQIDANLEIYIQSLLGDVCRQKKKSLMPWSKQWKMSWYNLREWLKD